MPLTAKRRAVLEAMWFNRESEAGHLTCAIPGGWRLGEQKVIGNVAFWLLRNGLICVYYSDRGWGLTGSCTVYVACPHVGEILKSTSNVPEKAA